jgi:hypothetical protein
MHMKRLASARGLVTLGVLLGLLGGCSGGGGGSPNTIGGNATGIGLMAGSVTFPGPYPTVGPVTYTTTSNTPVTVDAYPGQVVLHFDVTSSPNGTSSTNIEQREEHIKANNNATIIGKIPMIGFYLVKVPIGQENSFIQAMVSGGFGVDSAMPNIGLRRGISTPASIQNPVESGNLNAGPAMHALAFPGLIPFAGRESGLIVILDDFHDFKGSNHGNDVRQTIEKVYAALNTTGVTITNKQLPVQTDGSLTLDALAHSVIEALDIWAANSSPNITINLSWNVCEPFVTDCPNQNGTQYREMWRVLSNKIDVELKTVRDKLPDIQKDRFILVQEIGNAGLDISATYPSTYNAQVARGILGNHLFVGGSDRDSNGDLYATTVFDPNYHYRVGWYPGCISRNPDKCGSSFATPAVAALIALQYALLPPNPPNTFLNFTASQVREAVLVALLEYLDPTKPTDPSQIFAAAREVLNVSSATIKCGFDGGGGGPGGGPSVSIQPLPLDFMEALIGGQTPLAVTDQFTLASPVGDGIACNGTMTVSLQKQSATAWSFTISDTFTSTAPSAHLFVEWSAILPTDMTKGSLSVAGCGGNSSPALNIGTPLSGPLPLGAGTLAYSFAGIALGGPWSTTAHVSSLAEFLVYPYGGPPDPQIGAYPGLMPSCGVTPIEQIATVKPGTSTGGVPVVAMYSHANHCSDTTTCQTNLSSTLANADFFLSVQ